LTLALSREAGEGSPRPGLGSPGRVSGQGFPPRLGDASMPQAAWMSDPPE